VRADAVNRQKTQGKQDTFAEIWNPEDIGERFKKLIHRLL
jgi:hypothetical protein